MNKKEKVLQDIGYKKKKKEVKEKPDLRKRNTNLSWGFTKKRKHG